MSKPIRILLSEAATRHLEAAGQCFHIIAKDMSDQHTGRMVLHLVPCSMRVARDAEAVLMGKARAVFPKVSKPSPTAPLTPAEIRMA